MKSSSRETIIVMIAVGIDATSWLYRIEQRSTATGLAIMRSTPCETRSRRKSLVKRKTLSCLAPYVKHHVVCWRLNPAAYIYAIHILMDNGVFLSVSSLFSKRGTSLPGEALEITADIWRRIKYCVYLR